MKGTARLLAEVRLAFLSIRNLHSLLSEGRAASPDYALHTSGNNTTERIGLSDDGRPEVEAVLAQYTSLGDRRELGLFL